ncbi:hypothetical protein [Wolbachia endosymbiont of Pentidionis agamae]|uniref:hypothetical protein n=1 Tax=Wolbachia endosymbiont of Pentidionis agamae TaxID=3110435 RepID=UPI002FD1129D
MLRYKKKEWAGIVWDKDLCNKVKIYYPICTLEIKYLDSNRISQIKCPGGCSYDLYTDEILISTTKAFQNFKDGTCLYKVHKKSYEFIFIKESDSIATFFSTSSKFFNNKQIESCLLS